IGWGLTQPRSVETRLEFVRRYAANLAQAQHHEIMRFLERNQAALRQNPSVEKMRERMLSMLDILTDRDAPLADQLRSSLAIFAMHATWFVFRDPGVTDEQRQQAGLQVALELVGVEPSAAHSA